MEPSVPDRTLFDKMINKVKSLFGSKPDDRIGMATGWPLFDKRTRGFHLGKLYVAGGRPGDGKTSLGTSIAAQFVKRQENPVIFFSTELAADEILHQIVEAVAGGVPIHPNGRVSTADEIRKLDDALFRAGQELRYGTLKIEHSKRLTVEGMTQTIGNHCDHALGGSPALVIIDQASRIHRSDRDRHGYAIATEHLLNEIEHLAEMQCVPVLLLTQLNRNTEGQSKPMLSNIKHSGAFEEYAHAVYLLEREQRGFNPGSEPNLHASIHVAKNRHGIIGELPFIFDGEAHTWKERAKDYAY